MFVLALLFCAANISAFDVTGDHFDAKFKITSVTLGEKYSIINAESDAAGQYGKVYVSYKLKNTQILNLEFLLRMINPPPFMIMSNKNLFKFKKNNILT